MPSKKDKIAQKKGDKKAARKVDIKEAKKAQLNKEKLLREQAAHQERYTIVRSYLSRKMNRQGDTILSPMWHKRVSVDNRLEYITTIMNWIMSALSHKATMEKYHEQLIELMDVSCYMIELQKFRGRSDTLDAVIDSCYIAYIVDVFNVPTNPGIDDKYFLTLYERYNVRLTENITKDEIKGFVMNEIATWIEEESIAKSLAAYHSSTLANKKMIDEAELTNEHKPNGQQL